MQRVVFVPAHLLILVIALATLAFLSAGAEPERAQADPGHPRWGPGATAQGARVAANAAAVATCPASPAYSFTVADPTGDAFFGFGGGPVLHDITSVAVAGDGTTFCLTVSFAGLVEPGDANSAQSLFGYVEFDIDESFNTGFIPSNVDILCPDDAVIGADMVLDMFTVVQGNALLYDPTDPSGTSPTLVPVTFAATSFTAELPISALGGDTSLNFATVLGTNFEPTDCAPNGGSIHSPTGAIVPAPTLPDTDGDGSPDLFDNCPDIANPDQLDSDFDFIGDVCDPTPTHDIAITRTRAEGDTIRLNRDDDDDDDDDGGASGPVIAEIEFDIRVRNLLDQPETVFVALGFFEGLPLGCNPVDFPFKEVPIRGLGRKNVELNWLITCDPNIVAPGRYTVTVEVLAFSTGGADLDDSNNIVLTPAKLRVRD